MASSSLIDQTIKTTTGRTLLESSRSILQWNIENVDRILPDEAELGLSKSDKELYYSKFKALKSPVFTTTFGQTQIKKAEQKWLVDLDIKPPRSENNEIALTDEGNRRTISLYLCYHPRQEQSHVKPLRTYVRFSILGIDEEEVYKRSLDTTFETIMKDGLGYENFIELSELWRNKSRFIRKNVLRIKIDLMVYGSPLSTHTEKMDLKFQECLTFAKNECIDDMRRLFNSKINADITIHCGGRDFLVHTPILMGRCVVFNRMLEADMVESKEKVIKIDDVDPIVFEAFLEYIYTGQVELRSEYMDKLLGLVRVADKYGVEELKSICFKYMAENISLEKAGEIAVLAYLHNAEENIRSRIASFCHSNWLHLAEHSTFKICVSENPRAFFDYIWHNEKSKVEMED